MNIVIPVLVFCSVVMLSLALRSMLAPRVVGRRLARLGSSSQPVELEGESLVHGKEKGWSGVFARIGQGREGEDSRVCGPACITRVIGDLLLLRSTTGSASHSLSEFPPQPRCCPLSGRCPHVCRSGC